MMDKILKAYTDQIDREKKEKEEIKMKGEDINACKTLCMV